jgi:hypothetical protein
VSTWLTEAAADKLRNELLGAALDQWEETGSWSSTDNGADTTVRSVKEKNNDPERSVVRGPS